MEDLANDGTWTLLIHSKEDEDLMDNGSRFFVQHEGPNQVMNLILEKQAHNVFFSEISNSDDLDDQMQCVAQDEDIRNEQFMATWGTFVLDIFQLNVSSSALGCHTFGKLESLFKVLFLMQLQIGLKYEYLDDIENNIFFHFQFEIMML